MLKQKKIQNTEFQQIIKKQKTLIDSNAIHLREIEKQNRQLIRHNLLVDNAVLTQNNIVEIFSQSKDMFKSLMNDIDNAKKSINMCF